MLGSFRIQGHSGKKGMFTAAESPFKSGNLSRVVFATSAGTVFEAYDFILFGALAPIISVKFFAAVNDTAAFIFALLTFAAGYFIRPLGALVFGSIGDRTGRKKAFLITITMMGLSTFAIGLLPTYEQVGLIAPILLITLRLLQGLAFGGEYGGAVVYTAEHAPADKRGLFVGWIQGAAGFALFLSFLVIYLTRTAVGDVAFESWGWRIPFLLSILLLCISLWMRMALQESPVFQKMLSEGKASKKPVREAFGEWKNLKQVMAVLFGLMALQGVIFYTAHFYSQFFLMQVLKLPANTVNLIMLVVTAISVPLYVWFCHMSDKVGRKKCILAGGLLFVLFIFPIFQVLTSVVNPRLVSAQYEAPISVTADPRSCSLQFDPVGRAEFVTSCDIAKSALVQLGVSYYNREGSPGTLALVTVGEISIESIEGTRLEGGELAAARHLFEANLREILTRSGYPENVIPGEVSVPLLTFLMLLLVVCSTMVYAPCTVMALELFPTRIRYSALSLPYHIGSGWFGGFLPAIAFAMVAAKGNIHFGLWYPFTVALIGVLVLGFFLPETCHRDISRD
jgi:MFS family permease